MDDVSLLTFIAESFQVRPNWEYDECETSDNTSTRFFCKLDFSGVPICSANGKNKKDSKFVCAKRAICLVAPNVFVHKYPGEPIEHFRAIIEAQPGTLNEAQVTEEDTIAAEDVTLGYPFLMKR